MSVASPAQSFLIGTVSGVLSGAFGIGGGIITTPAIRLILKAPALVAVGTPLPVIVPGALTGAWTYLRRGLVDVRGALTVGLVGSVASVAGALASKAAGGSIVMLITAALIVYVAADTALWAAREGMEPRRAARPATTARFAGVGLAAGLYSGFLGLGGGFVIVPLLARWLGFDMKKAVGTSLLAVAVLAVPGSVTHYLLGHIDVGIALALTLGVVPGAALGSRLTLLSREAVVRYAFAGMLVCVAIWLTVGELMAL